MNDIHGLSHTQWNCKYHVVFAPKYRRKVFYGEKRLEIGAILRELCKWKGVNIIEYDVPGCLTNKARRTTAGTGSAVNGSTSFAYDEAGNHLTMVDMEGIGHGQLRLPLLMKLVLYRPQTHLKSRKCCFSFGFAGSATNKARSCRIHGLYDFGKYSLFCK